jgi:uncharacterized damage-inducible protein DinB
MTSLLTVQEYVARATEKKAQDLLAAAYAVPDDKHNWKLFGKGRTIVDLVAECAITNEISIKLLQERIWDAAGSEERHKAHAALDTLDKASTKLVESAAALAAALRAIPDEHLALEIVLPGETTTVSEDLLHSYWNMAYHEGQINYIGSLSEVGQEAS